MQRIRRLSTRLAQVPALAYLSAYVILIPLFALVFSALPDWYYHPAGPPSNPSPAQTEADIRRDLRLEIQQLYRERGGPSPVVNGWYLLLDQMDVPYLNTEIPVNFYFHLMLPVRRESDCIQCMSAIMQADVNVFTDGRYIRGETVYLPFMLQNAPLPAGLPPETPLPQLEFLLDQREILMQIGDLSRESSAEQNPLLPLSQGLYDRIIAYGESIQGPPADRYGGLLHFSTAVATFGAPKKTVTGSTLAELLVFVEAGLAVLLIGLFVMSLVYGLGESLRGTPQPGRRMGRTVPELVKKQPTRRPAKTSKLKSLKGSKWWNRTWVKIIAGILLLGLCGIIGGAAVLRTVVNELERLAYSSAWMTLPTEPPLAVPTPFVPTPTLVPAPTHRPSTQLDLPPIERNLLQNSGFEDGLVGWTYSDAALGNDVSEIAGIEGRALCSRRIAGSSSVGQRDSAAFVQRVGPIDPTAPYFFSAWVKLKGAVTVSPMARMSDWSGDEIGWALRSLPGIGSPPDGGSTGGWVYLHGQVSTVFPTDNYVLVGIWHGLVNDTQGTVDNTVCVDDVVFGKIVE